MDWKLPSPDMFVQRERRDVCIDCNGILGGTIEEFLGPKSLGDPAGWITPADYPAALRGRTGSIELTLSIDPRGTVRRCRVTRSSGLRPWDRLACDILRRRARFQPDHEAPRGWGSHHWVQLYSWSASPSR